MLMPAVLTIPSYVTLAVSLTDDEDREDADETEDEDEESELFDERADSFEGKQAASRSSASSDEPAITVGLFRTCMVVGLSEKQVYGDFGCKQKFSHKKGRPFGRPDCRLSEVLRWRP